MFDAKNKSGYRSEWQSAPQTKEQRRLAERVADYARMTQQVPKNGTVEESVLAKRVAGFTKPGSLKRR